MTLEETIYFILFIAAIISAICIYRIHFILTKGLNEIVKGMNSIEQRLSRIEKKIHEEKE